MWENINPEIRAVSEDIAKKNKFDTAILEAFRLIEGEIKERISSKSIGTNLINEAFDGSSPKINITDDTKNNEGIKNLFLGAMGFVRNDRAHKKKPLLPCQSMEICLHYLSFASFLLYLLGKDKNILPQISGIRLFGTPQQPSVEIRGINFTAGNRILANNDELKILRSSQTEIEVQPPPNFNGELVIISGENKSNSIVCDVSALEQKSDNTYEILSSDIPLYEDESCTKLIKGVVGILMQSTENTLQFQRISPTKPGIYESGMFINYDSFISDSVDETWYRHPVTGSTKYAWLGSLIMMPTIIGKVGEKQVINISIKPDTVKIQPKEIRALRVIAALKDDKIRFEKDISIEVKEWKSSNESVAFVKNGAIHSKKVGKAKIECQHKGFLSSVDVLVENYAKGDIVTYFQGIKNIQQIAFDPDDNLFICNQSPYVYKVSNQGKVSEIVRIPFKETEVVGIDCIMVDKHFNLYVNDVTHTKCLKFPWNGEDFDTPIKIATSVQGTPKSISVDENNNVFVAVMLDQIVRVKPDGSEFSFPTRDMAIYLAIDSEGFIYVPSAKNHSIDVYSQNGQLVRSIIHGIVETPVGIVIDNKDNIYLLLHESGRLIKIINTTLILSPENLGTFKDYPRGVAMDSKGRIYISADSGNRIEMIY